MVLTDSTLTYRRANVKELPEPFLSVQPRSPSRSARFGWKKLRLAEEKCSAWRADVRLEATNVEAPSARPYMTSLRRRVRHQFVADRA
ncbi:hypothetical protein GWI33_013853 [Rhynchophorus ferrugineus]|uniref:Uncharacterized protein n=1 Tax=Rhynchophorus ferrugineus TaxID=354439 RepID=A0A834I2Y0_RHYFE|nr:hypothetical protein GWI33_013853 [Rhynchophorus ferrugineus]